MHCTQCGQQVRESDKFCAGCGAKIGSTNLQTTDASAPVKKRPWLKNAAAIIAVIVFIPLAQEFGRYRGKSDAIASVSQDARTAGMPDGLLGVRFLESLSTVRGTRPNIQPMTEIKNSWSEMTEWEGYPVRAIYTFDDTKSVLLMILLNLDGQASRESFAAVNNILERKYGALSSPTANRNYSLYAERAGGGLKLWHGLIDSQDGRVVEQVVLFKEGPHSAAPNPGKADLPSWIKPIKP